MSVRPRRPADVAALGVYLSGAVLLVAAGLAKLARPGDTARALRLALGVLPPGGWVVAVRVAAGAEVALGAVAFLRPGRGPALAEAVSYAVFAGFVLLVRSRGGPLATCGCFARPDTPPTAAHAGVDLTVAAAALAVAAAGPRQGIAALLAHQYAAGVPLVAAVVAASWLALLVMGPMARLQALHRADPPGGPPAPRRP